jgi:teichuronic acid biosynthesis glycosyltransferase TuaH
MSRRSWVLLLAGSRWDEVPGTDRQLAEALGERVEVLWVDPPRPLTALLGPAPPRRELHQVAVGVHRLQPVVPPASTRPGVRQVATVLVEHRVLDELRRRQIEPLGTVLLSPRVRFPLQVGGARLLFVTDDWVAGAGLMGLSRPWVRRRLVRNLGRADVVAAVTPHLADRLRALVRREVVVVPNGTRLHARHGELARWAGVVGQLNERLDFDVLDELARRDVPLLLVGPRAVREGPLAARLDTLLARRSVDWAGAVGYADLGAQLDRLVLGLTPYADTAFNRASFPLKTLEYLGAGLPVVSTDLPAARALATEHVAVARGPHAFADQVQRLLAVPPSRAAEEARRSFAAQHSWTSRAGQLLGLLEAAAGSPRPDPGRSRQ